MTSADSGALQCGSSARGAERAGTGAGATLFSTWTPVTNKPSNQQLFQERTTLILHWFDLWTDGQRKHLLHLLLRRCPKSQLKFVSDRFMEAVPITQLDFVTVLPRFLSLYILSFLNPVDLSAAAQVSWHWRFLAEQDCLWLPKCVRRGWFLPYSPSDTEYGAWKRHYVACAASLDTLYPREAGDIYGTLSESVMESEEQKERRTEHIIRQTIRGRIAEHKRHFPFRSSKQSGKHFPVHLLLVSSSIPAYELVLGGALAHTLPLLYDYSGMTLEALLSLIEKAIEGRAVQSVGILTEGSTEDFSLSITERTVVKPGIREFWERLCGWVVPASEAGSLNIFAPLGASAAGVELMTKLSTLTGLMVRAPTGICTGSYQHILSDWSDHGEFPPLLYLRVESMLSWCRQAEQIEQTLQTLRNQLEPQLQLLSQETRGRCLGKADPSVQCSDVIMTAQSSKYCNKWLLLGCGWSNPAVNVEGGGFGAAGQREVVCLEILRSEKDYVRLLQAVNSVYYSPLRAALDSNRAIISSTSLLTLFCPLLDILAANRVFLQDLSEKLEEWSPLQCLGEVFVRFCTKLRTYTNFFNNYPTAIRTIDTCRETLPAFRAFLKRQDRTLATGMLSLQELFLSPSTRVEEYVTLLQALLLQTTPEHPDHAHLTSNLQNMLCFKNIKHNRVTNLLFQNLQEEGRYLITTQDVVLLNCLNEDITPSLRMYECVGELGLVLFNDALVLSEKRRTHRPFSSAVNISYTFLASVALHSLSLSEIHNTKYVQNTFLLESPKRRWICSTEREQDKIRWLGALRSAINAANHN
uniref:DH domain-containing protein n=1 Tax=Astyanax mexicanus TaxID=7994 RepID=A0A8B9K611_ASTMX